MTETDAAQLRAELADLDTAEESDGLLSDVELSLLFAGVRGSTALADRASPAEFSTRMNSFFDIATDVLSEAATPAEAPR